MASIRRQSLLLVFVALAGAGCSEDAAPAAPAASSAPIGSASAASSEAAPEFTKLKTTSPKIAVGNLNARIKGVSAAMRGAEAVTVRTQLTQRLVEELLRRGAWLGRPDDFLEAKKLAEELVQERPEDPLGYVVRAQVRAALHQNTESLADLDKAKELGGVVKPAMRRTALIGLGRYDEALEEVGAGYKEFPKGFALALGSVLAHKGELERADTLLQEAEMTFLDTNPFTLASIYARRAAMWEDAGDLKKARIYYEKAYERMPQYAHATTHLALLLPPTEGLKVLAELDESSTDPHVLVVRGTLQNLKEPGSGDEALKKAEEAYAKLLEEAPEAYADHAAALYEELGNDEAAFKWTLVDARARPTADKLVRVMELAKTGRDEAYCEAVQLGRKAKHRTQALDDALARVGERCPAEQAPEQATDAASPTPSSPGAPPTAAAPTTPPAQP